ADEPVAITLRTWLRIPVEPTELTGTDLETVGEAIARPRIPVWIRRPVVRQPQCYRVHVERVRQLIHGGLQHEPAHRLARATRKRRSHRVAPNEVVYSAEVRAFVHLRRHPGGRFRPIVEVRTDRQLLVVDRCQPAVLRRADRDALLLFLAMAGRGEHL